MKGDVPSQPINRKATLTATLTPTPHYEESWEFGGVGGSPGHMVFDGVLRLGPAR